MKQKIFLLMALMAATITFSACSSDDDDNDNSPIVGTWYNEDDGYSEEITFKKNGTVTSATASLRYSSIRYRDTGTYKLNGNKLTIHWTKWETWNRNTQSWTSDDDTEETVVITINVTDTTLTFISMEDEEDGEPVVYTKK